jgi:hypothetical protein
MPIGNLLKFGGRALGQATDPTNYKFLKEAAEGVLSRTVPQGVNFGALPTQFLNTLTDIQQMAPGAAKEAARNKAKTTLTRAAKAQGPAPRPAGQGASGALRAPSVGIQPVRPTPTTVAPRTNIPGSPLATDYALSRQTGMTQALGQARNAAKPAAQNFLGRMMSAGGGKVGFGFDLLNPVPGIGMGGSLASALGLGGAAGLATTVGGGLLAAGAFDAAFPQGVASGTLDAERKRGGFKGKPMSALEMRAMYGGSGDMDAGPSTVSGGSTGQQPPADTGVEKGGRQAVSTGSASLDPRDRAYVEEVSRLAQQAQTDPYFQQMQQYERQGKQAVGSGNQAQMDAVRDLGLAINAAKFGTPEQRMQQTVGRFNPQMAGMPGYPATREAFEQQKPFIAPEEEARIGAMDMASQALQGAMQGQAGTQFPAQALGVMQRPAGVSPNTSAFAGPQAGQAGMSMSPTTDISALPEEAKAEFLKRLQSFRPM